MCLGSQKVLSSILRVCNRYPFVLCAVFFFFLSARNWSWLASTLGALDVRAEQKPTLSPACRVQMKPACLQYQTGAAIKNPNKAEYTDQSAALSYGVNSSIQSSEQLARGDQRMRRIIRKVAIMSANRTGGLEFMFDVRVRRIHQKPQLNARIYQQVAATTVAT
jgi:hypothetical protein